MTNDASEIEQPPTRTASLAGDRRIGHGHYDRWTNDRGNGSMDWHLRVRFWRVEVHFNLMRHRYPKHPDRWVLQPHFIYDRKLGRGYLHGV